MAKLVDSSNHSQAYEGAMMLCIALKIGVTHTDDMVVAQTAKYLIKGELSVYDDNPYEATRKVIAKIANKVLDDMEAEVG